MTTAITTDDLQELLTQEGTGPSELISDEHDTFVELIETGSAAITVNGTELLLTINIQKV